MITKDDIIRVDISKDMILDAVHYAEKSLHFTFNRMASKDPYNRIRNIVKGLIMESAFKHLLNTHNVSYDLLGNTHYTKKDRYDVGINGIKFDIKGYFVDNSYKINLINRDVSWFLDCCALVPSDQIQSASLQKDDVYVFPFLIGACESGVPQSSLLNFKEKYLLHDFSDYKWIKNKTSPLGKIFITSRCNSDISFRLGGQDANSDLLVEEIILKANSSYVSINSYQTVLFAQTNQLYSGSIVFTASKNGLTRTISVNDWGNIWVYDALVYFTGMITKGEFKNKTIEIPRFYHDCKQYSETQTLNNMMLIKDLYPIQTLF